jgi:hypothetical protein
MKVNKGIEAVRVSGAAVVPESASEPVSPEIKSVDNVTLPVIDQGYFVHPEGHPKEWVIVRDTGLPHEKKQPFVALNGYAYQFQKNVPIELPVPVINMMRNCIETTIERDPQTGIESKRDIPRFSIERLDHAPDGLDQKSA